MSSSDEDIDLTAFVRPGKRSDRRVTPSENSAGNAEQCFPPLAREQRRIASDQRRLDGEVARDEERAALIRGLTLNGLEAKKQAHECAGAHTDTKPIVPEHNSVSVAEAYALAVSCERRLMKLPTTEARLEQDEVVRLWQLVYSLAEADLRMGGEPERLYRAQMTSLCHQAPFYELKLQYRFAINLLERVLVLSKGRRLDTATRASLIAVYRKLSSLYTSIGAVEKAQQRIVSAHSLLLKGKRAPEPGAVVRSASADEPLASVFAGPEIVQEAVVPTKPPPATRSTSPAALARSISAPAACLAGIAAIPKGEEQQHTDILGMLFAASSEFSNSNRAAAAIPTASGSDWTAAFDHPADGSARHAFLQAMRDAMVSNAFEALMGILNKALLGDKAAQAVMHSPLEGSKITAVMVAAGAGRADVIRRLLAPLSPPRVAQVVLYDLDFAGHNAFFHACATENLASVHELLVALHAVRAWNGLPPSSLAQLGLNLDCLLGFASPVQHLLNAAMADFERYIRDGRMPALAPLSAPVLPLQQSGSWMPQVRLPPQPLPLTLSPMVAMQMQMAAALRAPALPQQPAAKAAFAASAAPSPAALLSSPPGAAAPLIASSSVGTAKINKAADTSAVASSVCRSAPLSRGPQKGPPPATAPARASTAAVVKGPQGERALIPMDLPSANLSSSAMGGLEDSALEEGASASGRWDQFSANAALGVCYSGFNEGQYTSVLNRGAFSEQQIAFAETLARAICEQPLTGDDPSNIFEDREEAGTSATGTGCDDEEARYSSVARPAAGNGRYDSFTDAGVASASAIATRQLHS